MRFFLGLCLVAAFALAGCPNKPAPLPEVTSIQLRDVSGKTMLTTLTLDAIAKSYTVYGVYTKEGGVIDYVVVSAL